MPLPYESTTAGANALSEIQKILRDFGCTSFGSMIDDEEQVVLVQFRHRGRQVSVRASVRGYAAAWLREHPYSTRTRSTQAQHQRKAMEIASKAVYSILRDLIKGQVAAVETGILSFEGAFLGSLMLPNGKTVLEHAQAAALLPAPEGSEA